MFINLARIGRPDIFWSVNKFARAKMKWTKSCDKHLVRVILYIHHTSEYRQYCYVGMKTQNQHQVDFCAFSEAAKHLDVHETDLGLTQFNRSRAYLF